MESDPPPLFPDQQQRLSTFPVDGQSALFPVPLERTWIASVAREEREQQREARRIQASLSPQRGPRLSNLSLERFRTSNKYQDRPAAADIAFCVAAYANGMTENRIERALEDDYLSRDPSTSKRAAYIRRTMEKARRWAER